VGTKFIADARVRARKLFLFYKVKKQLRKLFFALFKKAKASEAFAKKISLALESSHQ